MTERVDVAVVGAGIAGLAAAAALQDRGVNCVVFEAKPEAAAGGSGLAIWPNGAHALRALGLSELVERAPRNRGALRRADGSVLAAFDPAEIERRYGAPLIGVDRGDLHTALLGRQAHPVRGNHELVRMDDGVLQFAEGERVAARLVVGADGIWSAVRRDALSEGAPADSGITAVRATCAWEGEVPTGEWWGPGVVCGLLPLASGRVYWYVAGRADEAEELLERASGFGSPIPEIVEATEPEALLVHRLFDRPLEVDRRALGRRTVLIGDALHPMLPFLGQGACCALEDGVLLARAVSEETVADFMRSRSRRGATLVRDSRRAARVALARSGAARSVRDALLSRASSGLRFRQLDAAVAPGIAALGESSGSGFRVAP